MRNNTLEIESLSGNTKARVRHGKGHAKRGMTRVLIAVALLVAATSAHAVLRSPFPRKPGPPHSGTVMVVDGLKHAK